MSPEEHQWRQSRPWHLDPCSEYFIHCCPDATQSARDWLTQQGTFTPEEGFKLHGLRIMHLLGVKK